MLLFHIIVVHTFVIIPKKIPHHIIKHFLFHNFVGCRLLSSLSHSSLTIDPEALASSRRCFACSCRAYGTMLGCGTASCFNHSILITTYSRNLHTMSHLNTINLHLLTSKPVWIHSPYIEMWFKVIQHACTMHPWHRLHVHLILCASHTSRSRWRIVSSSPELLEEIHDILCTK